VVHKQHGKLNWGGNGIKHLRYLRYVLRHKWFVFIACCKLGVPWRGIAHDMSKFAPSEWFPYAEHFYGGNRDIHFGRDKSGYYRAGDTGDMLFDFAWLYHQKRNPHHWQWWVLPLDDGGQKILPMSDSYRKEMLADWYGAGRALGKPDTQAWYLANKDKMLLHPDTRQWIEAQLFK
jgi:hypothetical protein